MKINSASIKRLLLLAIIPVVAWIVSHNWYQLMLIQGDSMLPNYHNMQIVILNRHDRSYQYGDVVAFSCEDLSCVLVKRIGACPEDIAVIDDGTLFVNGTVSQVYPQTSVFSYAGLLSESIVLGTKEYLVFGDNLAESKDSRYIEVGIINKDQIIGKVQNNG